ncbi:autotransporter outer membrane beta-barrel domain-containing protein [Aestuariivirga sp. YIM B02566]|uniref:Autotransporter domain-containing protein n=1 Tax=Taklimakanibacter albus TaxID=2800327 RepID=A0ACC5RBI5_9HYPH|nr:autotransporter domain-containing protein [Aestuariivirga sp. YIM B02566]MBK1869985.1 autotransporter domain-containing protein [Aestuariivirga sp. YIM B02566]
MRTAFTGFRRRLTGTTALTVLAAGALALSGGYAGAVTINDGVTVIAGSDVDPTLGAAGETITLDGGVYNASTNVGANAILQTTGTFSTSRTINFTNFGGRIETDAGTTLTATGLITGGGGANFIKQGAGTLVFTGDGTGFTGTTRVYGGTLRIEGGGDLGGTNAAGGAIGNGGTVVVTGAGSTWTNYGQIGVGKIGSGTMTISAGGKVFSGNAGAGGTTGGIIGESGASAVTITGAGSEWATDKANLYVGHFNTGELTLTDSGTMKVGATGTGTVIAGITAAGIINIGAAEASAAAAAGTLQAGSVSFGVAGSKVVFNHTDANYTFAAAISGTGTVRQFAGTTVLSSVNTYSGGTLVQGGILRAGVAGAFVNNTSYTVAGGALDLNDFNLVMSSLAGTGGEVTIGTAELTVAQATNTTYAGQLVGSGDIIKSGAGSLLLIGDSSATFTGTTTVSGGGLYVGDLIGGKLGGDITVETGGRLGGIGNIGSTGKTVEIEAGGTHAPGNSIGTQVVDANYINHGILEIEATPTAADKLIVNGTVDIAGADLQLVLTPNVADDWGVLTGPYVIIDNDGTDAVTGTFNPITSDQPFLDALINYAGGTGNDVTLQLVRNDVAFVEVAETRNQRATAGAVDTLDVSSEVWVALAMAGSEEEARALLDELSGEVHASLIGMLNQDSRFWRNAANDRLRQAFGGVAASGGQVMGFSASGVTNGPADTQGLALWTRGFGSWAKTDSDGNAADFTRNTGGILAGADIGVAKATRLGVLAGYAHSSFDADDRDSSGDVDSYQIGLYGGTQIDAVGLRAGVAYAWHNIDTEREALGDDLDADYDAGTVQVFGEAGYTFDLDSLRLEPFANAAYVSTKTDDFEEDGGPAALSSDSETNDNTFTTLGLRAAVGFNVGEMPASFRAMAGWRHAFGDVRPETTFAFEGSEDFVIAGAPIARDAAVLEAGFDVSLSSEATFGIAYSGEIGNDAEDHGLNATLAVEF